MLARRGSRGQLDVGPRPEVAQVAHGQVDRQPHLARHDDEHHIPPQRSYYEEDGAASLAIRVLFVSLAF
jgi:hypothetical protein